MEDAIVKCSACGLDMPASCMFVHTNRKIVVWVCWNCPQPHDQVEEVLE